MREILFRGKRIDNGEWVKGFYFLDPEDGSFIFDFEYVHCNGSFDEPPSGYFKKESNQVIPETVGQFTGLTDKNGVKIFEGDYIKLIGGLRLEFYPDNGVVVFNQTSFVMKSKTESGNPWHFSINFSDGTEIEIIGNIHDNPELLK